MTARVRGPEHQRVDPTMLLGVGGTTELFLVRHAKQTVADELLDVTVGELHDPPLSELGLRQAAAVAAALALEGVEAVCSSPIGRARETAAAIAAAVGVDVQEVEGIEEFGMFRDLPDGQTPREALGAVQFAGFQHRWSRTRRWDAWPASEPVGEFRDRVITGLEGILALHRGRRVAVVTHGGSINAYLAEILGTRDDMFFNPAHASVTRVRAKHDRRVLVTLNELHHLRDPDELLTF